MYRTRSWILPNGRQVKVAWGGTTNRRLGLSVDEAGLLIDRMAKDSAGRRQLFAMLRSMCYPPPLAPHDSENQVAELKRLFARGDWVVLRPAAPVIHPMKGGLGLPLAPVDASDDVATKEKLGWFDVTLVDAWGDPVGDVELEISYAGTKKKLTAPGNGHVHLDEVDASFGSVRFVDVKELREVLRPRFVKKPPATPPDVENPTVLGVSDEMGSVPLESEVPKTIVLTKPLTRVRLIGMHFDTNKSFMRKTAIPGIRRVVREYAELGQGNLLVVGHTDTVAEEHYNLDLSVERAEAVKAYVKNDVPGWDKWFADTVYPDKKKWGDGEIAHMISALPCEQSVLGFQQWSNANRPKGKHLDEDSILGPKTRHELIKAYMELEETTLPPEVGVEIHGCGEYFPATEDQSDGVESEENRRVELFCFDDKIHPPVPGKRAKRGEPEYPQWKAQVTKTVDVGAKSKRLMLRLYDYDGDPVGSVPVKLQHGVEEIRTTSDQLGLLTADLSEPVGRVDIEWLTERDAPAFAMRRRLFPSPDDSRIGDEQRLQNLGYLRPSVADNVREFQADYGLRITGLIADVSSALRAFHDSTILPTKDSNR